MGTHHYPYTGLDYIRQGTKFETSPFESNKTYLVVVVVKIVRKKGSEWSHSVPLGAVRRVSRDDDGDSMSCYLKYLLLLCTLEAQGGLYLPWFHGTANSMPKREYWQAYHDIQPNPSLHLPHSTLPLDRRRPICDRDATDDPDAAPPPPRGYETSASGCVFVCRFGTSLWS